MDATDLLACFEEHAAAGVPCFPFAISHMGADDAGRVLLQKRPTTRHGHLDATLDQTAFEQQVAAARLTTGEELVIGGRPGLGGFVVLDCDVKRGSPGLDTLERLRAEYGEALIRVAWTSPSGGLNVVLRKPEGATFGNASDLPGVDIRADSGGVVLPGSMTPWGAWAWQVGEWADATVPPDQLLAHFRAWHKFSRAVTSAALDRFLDADRPITEGAWAAFIAREEGLYTAVCAAGGRGSRHDGYLVPIIGTAFGLRFLDQRRAFRIIRERWRALLAPVERRREDEPLEVACWVLAQETENRWDEEILASIPIGELPPPPPPPPPDDDDDDIDEEDVDPDLLDMEILTGPTPPPLSKMLSPKVGLRAVTTMRAVVGYGAIQPATDDRLWAYHAGVYRPNGKETARGRLRRLLGEKYRPGHLTVILDMLRTRRVIDPEVFPDELINVRNGLLDWRTGALVEHTAHVPSTYQLQCDWDPKATCPTVDAWLAQVVDEDVVELVWEVVGMAVYAGLPFHRAIMLSGPGRNGKGTLLRLIKALVGRLHCGSVTLQQLAEDRFAVAQLYGKVCNLAGDLDARAVAATGVFKMVTGEDSTTVQHKYGQPFELENRALMVFAANELPIARDHSEGYESRWIVVPFSKLTLGPGQEDKTLEPRMHRELAGVLVRAVGGIRSALGRGDFIRPPSVVAATAEFRRASNPVALFIEDCLEVTGLPTDDVARAAVYLAYQQWCARSGHRPLAVTRFWPEVRKADERIDTGTSPTNPHGYRYAGVQTVQGVASVLPTAFMP